MIGNGEEFEINCDSCKPYSFTDFSKFSDSLSRDAFSISHINIRSLPKNFDELKLFHESTPYDFKVIALSEVWQIKNKDLYNLTNFSFETKCRTNQRGGGVGAYIHTSLNYSMFDINVCHAETLWLNIHMGGDRSITIGIIYRKPNTNVDEFLESLEAALLNITSENSECILIGDFNINVHCLETSDVRNLCHTMSCLDFRQVITVPTRIVICNKHAPLVTKNSRCNKNSKKPWLSVDLKKSIKT